MGDPRDDQQQPQDGLDEERRRIGEHQDRLDEEADGEGLAAEAGRAEGAGLSEG